MVSSSVLCSNPRNGLSRQHWTPRVHRLCSSTATEACRPTPAFCCHQHWDLGQGTHACHHCPSSGGLHLAPMRAGPQPGSPAAGKLLVRALHNCLHQPCQSSVWGEHTWHYVLNWPSQNMDFYSEIAGKGREGNKAWHSQGPCTHTELCYSQVCRYLLRTRKAYMNHISSSETLWMYN